MPIIINNDNSKQTITRRIRRTPEDARRIVIDAAQAILVQDGPAAITLQRVAATTGMTHGNLTHHFGSSAAIQTALIQRLAAQLARDAKDSVDLLRLGSIAAADVVDLIFIAFVGTGIGKLIAWLAATGQRDALIPVFASLAASVTHFKTGEPMESRNHGLGAGPISLSLLRYALTVSLIGADLEQAAAMPRGSLRNIAIQQVEHYRAR